MHPLMRYQVQHSKRNSTSTSSHVLFWLLYKHTDDESFDDFPKISKHFPNISEDSPKVVLRPDISFSNISEIPKITKDYYHTGTHLSTFQKIMKS